MLSVCRYDGLKSELEKTENNTASMAFAYNNQMLASDMTAYAQISLFTSQFFQDDCFSAFAYSNTQPSTQRSLPPKRRLLLPSTVEGRDWRLMQEVFLHFFEQYGAVTLLLLFCGCKVCGSACCDAQRPSHLVVSAAGQRQVPACGAGQGGVPRGLECGRRHVEREGAKRSRSSKDLCIKRPRTHHRPA